MTQSDRAAAPSATHCRPFVPAALGSPGSFPQAEAAPQPTPLLKTHTPSPKSSQVHWKGSVLWGSRKSRMEQIVNRNPESPEKRDFQGNQKGFPGKCRRKGKQTQQSPLRGKEVKGKTHKSSLKGAAPFLSKGQLQSLPKIPH